MKPINALMITTIAGATVLGLFQATASADASQFVVNDQCKAYISHSSEVPVSVVRLSPVEGAAMPQFRGKRDGFEFSVRILENATVAVVRDTETGVMTKAPERIAEGLTVASIALEQVNRPRAWIACYLEIPGWE